MIMPVGAPSTSIAMSLNSALINVFILKNNVYTTINWHLHQGVDLNQS